MLRRFIVPIAAVGLLALSQFGLPFAIGAFGSSGLAFPDPVIDQAVYDPAGALDPQTEASLESRIDAIETRSGAEVVIYTRVAPTVDNDTNLADARRLMDQWGIGRSGFDDGFVILVSFFDNSIPARLPEHLRGQRLQGRLPVGGSAGAPA